MNTSCGRRWRPSSNANATGSTCAYFLRDIDEGLEKGKIESGASEVGVQEIDAEAAVGTALQAFEDGLFLVAVDDRQHRELDRQVFLQADNRITFIRLTLLAGG